MLFLLDLEHGVKKGSEAVSQLSGTEGSKNWWRLSWLTLTGWCPRGLFWFQVWLLLLGDEPRAIWLWSLGYPLAHQVRTQREAGHKQTKERAFTRNCPCWHLDLVFLVSRTVRQWISVVQATQSVILPWLSDTYRLSGFILEIKSTDLESNLAFELFNISIGFCGVHVGYRAI